MKDVENKNFTYKAITTNISGGGLQLLSDVELTPGKLFNINLKLDYRKNVKAAWRVLRVESKNNHQENFLIAGKFTNISSADKVAIVQLCSKKNLETKYKKSIYCSRERG